MSMMSAPGRVLAEPQIEASGERIANPDGRQLRRLRNIESVREAILQLHEERGPLDLETVASRAGVTIRSIYRYYADLDAAIDDALRARVDLIQALWEDQTLPDPSMPTEEKVSELLALRMEIERLGRPLRNVLHGASPDPMFDAEVQQVFEPELGQLPDELRRTTSAAVCYLFRPRGIRPMMEHSNFDDLEPREVLAAALLRLLAAPSA